MSHLLALCLVLSAAPAEATRPAKLRYEVPLDAPLTVVPWLGWAGSELVFKRALAPTACRWCDRTADGTDTLNAVDRWGRGLRAGPEQLGAWDTASGAVGYGALIAVVAGLDVYAATSDGELADAWIDLLIIAEAVGMSQLTNQAVKFGAGRERPFVHQLDEAQRAQTASPRDNNLSFYSGHSNFALALAVSAGTVANLRGYSKAWLVWLVTLPLALSVPLMRMAADKHYLTDVMVGSGVGALFGWAVPTLLHGRLAEAQVGAVRIRLAPVAGGVGVAGVIGD